MEFKSFCDKCRNEPTVSDFESYLSYCIFEKGGSKANKDTCTLEMYSYIRDQAFELRDTKAAQVLYDLAGAANWKEGEWEGAMR